MPASHSSPRWICEQIPGAAHVTFDADEGASHFMFHEDPRRFNEVVGRLREADPMRTPT